MDSKDEKKMLPFSAKQRELFKFPLNSNIGSKILTTYYYYFFYEKVLLRLKGTVPATTAVSNDR